MSDTHKMPSLIETRVDRGNYVECTRKDGLKVFLGKDDSYATKVLNAVREFAPRAQVYSAYAMIRGLVQARGYALKHGTEEEAAKIDQDLDFVLDRLIEEARLKGLAAVTKAVTAGAA
jgi:hypothetical protein